jgi:hypothetical protein
MPERHSIETFSNPGNPEGSFEFETRADFHRGNPDLIPFEQVEAANEARALATPGRPERRPELTPAEMSKEVGRRIIYLRSNELGVSVQPSMREAA